MIRGLDTLATVAVLIAVLAIGAGKWSSYQRDMAELAELRDYKRAVELREEITRELTESYRHLIQERDEERVEHDDHRRYAKELTNEAAKDDPRVADFLATPIPERLREADRQARTDRLERGAISRRNPGSADAD